MAQVKDTKLSSEDWDANWQIGKTAFHRPTVHDDLMKHEQLLLPNPSRVFVPLCGKTVDMKYLADKGHEVVGLEFSEKAVNEFFEEQSLKYQKTSKPGAPLQCYKADNASISIFCGDMFKASTELIGKFDAVWDRGSFVAINTEDRQKYASIMRQLVNTNGKILLNAFEYDATKYGGPPHNTPQSVVEQCFESCFQIKCLNSYDFIKPNFKEKGLDNMVIKNYLLTRIQP